MKNLNKQNYFNEAWLNTFPSASKDFCKYIDTYKLEIGWDHLFNYFHSGDLPAPKFHDIPFELQYGILCKYFQQYNITDIDFSILLNEVSEGKSKMFKRKWKVYLNSLFWKVEKIHTALRD